MTTLSASAKSLAITELLETILLEVDQKTLLTSCLRVKKQWKDLLDTSSALRKRLFFQPHYPPPHELPPREPEQPRQALKGQYEWNPFLASCVPNKGCWLLHARYLVWNNPRAWKRKNASWQRMQMTRPPIETVRLVDDFSGSKTLQYYNVDLPKTPTLRMGDLFTVRGILAFDEATVLGVDRRFWTLHVEVQPGKKSAIVWVAFWTDPDRNFLARWISNGPLFALRKGIGIIHGRQQREWDVPQFYDVETHPWLRRL